MTSASRPTHISPLWRIFFLVLALAIAGWGIFSRLEARAALKKEAAQESAIYVETVLPIPETHEPPLVLPGQLQAWTETPIYAHTDGYLQRWLVDIGQPVKKGQLIAEISTPELDQQEAQAKADVAAAYADAQLAQLTAQRYHDLLPSKTISQQDADNQQYAANAKAAALISAQANLKRLHALDVYKRIVAPVDGIVTVRNVDIGTMIDSGSANGKATELFHVASIDRLRAYIPIPENESGSIHSGDLIMFDTRQYPGKHWQAKLVRHAKAIDPVTHTELVELQLNNPDDRLLPGDFIEARFSHLINPGTVTVPANALIFRASGTLIATVDTHNKVHLQKVLVGRDFGRRLEIITGLSPQQAVIVSPPDSITEGQSVIVHALDKSS